MLKFFYPGYKRKESDDMKSYEELAKEQAKREGNLLSKLMGEAGMEELADFEAGLGERQSEILFKITTEMEDTENALNQVEQLAQRLKKHLERLKKLQQTLSK
jgi:SpoVK/Ycf46/Vps4 family AAA+-type ATPase